MRVRQLSVASSELAEAMNWYRQRSPDAAEHFLQAILDARQLIVHFPLAAPLVARRARRFDISGFPYGLIYSVLTNEIVIVAYAHHSRRPSYWKTRIQDIH